MRHSGGVACSLLVLSLVVSCWGCAAEVLEGAEGAPAESSSGAIQPILPKVAEGSDREVVGEHPRAKAGRLVLSLPEDAEPHEGKAIGPFCCSGYTAIVPNLQGKAMGYIHFFSWQGQAVRVQDKVMAPDLMVHVSEELGDKGKDEPLIEALSWKAKELVPGSEKSFHLGTFDLLVTVHNAALFELEHGIFYDVGSLKMTVKVVEHSPSLEWKIVAKPRHLRAKLNKKKPNG
jgi:hypothetical protein